MMSKNLLSSVFKTIWSRRDAKLFLAFSFLPILVPFLSGNMEGMQVDYTKSFLSFLEITLSTQYRLVLPILIFSLLISSVFRDEINSGIMFLFKDINRSHIFNAKLFGLFGIYTLYTLGTSLLSLITYYAILLPKWHVSTNFIPSSSLVIQKSLLSILSIVLINLATILIVAMVATGSKTITAVLSGVFSTLFAVTAPFIIGLRYLIPTTYVSTLSEGNFIKSFVIIILLSGGYILISYIKGKKKFEKVEF